MLNAVLVVVVDIIVVVVVILCRCQHQTHTTHTVSSRRRHVCPLNLSYLSTTISFSLCPGTNLSSTLFQHPVVRVSRVRVRLHRLRTRGLRGRRAFGFQSLRLGLDRPSLS